MEFLILYVKQCNTNISDASTANHTAQVQLMFRDICCFGQNSSDLFNFCAMGYLLWTWQRGRHWYAVCLKEKR